MSLTKSQPCLTWHSPSLGTGSFRHTGASMSGRLQQISQLPVSTVLGFPGHRNPGLTLAPHRIVTQLLAHMLSSHWLRTFEMDSPTYLLTNNPRGYPVAVKWRTHHPQGCPVAVKWRANHPQGCPVTVRWCTSMALGSMAVTFMTSQVIASTSPSTSVVPTAPACHKCSPAPGHGQPSRRRVE